MTDKIFWDISANYVTSTRNQLGSWWFSPGLTNYAHVWGQTVKLQKLKRK